MCECGCTMNDDRFRFPAPNGAIYVLSLAGHCTDCDAPSGVTIELIEPTHPLFREYNRGDFSCEPLAFEKWADSKGVAIVTGHTKHKFVVKSKKYLVGVPLSELADESGKLDDIAAETLLEEMYDDVQVKPQFPKKEV